MHFEGILRFLGKIILNHSKNSSKNVAFVLTKEKKSHAGLVLLTTATILKWPYETFRSSGIHTTL